MSDPYIVKPGDTLGGIAQAHNITLGELLLVNPQLSADGRNPRLIFPGESVAIPKEGKFRQTTDLKHGKELCKKSECDVIKKNIVFIGSEMHYDSFWWKMMFMAPAIVAATGGASLRKADLTVIAYVAEGYTYLEKLPIDLVAGKYGHKVVALSSSADIVTVMNDLPTINNGNCTECVKLQDVVFFGHGLPSKIALNYGGYGGEVNLTPEDLASIAANAFVANGAIYSYACRTGNASLYDSDWFPFKSDAEAHPEASLAQQMANRFGVTVHAFLTRTYYGGVLRNPADSQTITSALKTGRVGKENDVITLSSEHEALPHPGLAESAGARKEGSNGFALWRKAGARQMPEGGDTPKGLSRTMREYTPTKSAGGSGK